MEITYSPVPDGILRNADLRTLIARLQHEKHHRFDLVVPASKLTMQDDGRTMFIHNAPAPGDSALARQLEGLGISTGGGSIYRTDLLDVAHGGFAQRLEIPKRYYNRMKDEAPDLLAANVNRWLGQDERQFLARTWRPSVDDPDGSPGLFRALLSDRYQMLDNYDLLVAALGVCRDSGIEVTPKVSNLSPRKMQIIFEAPEVYIDGTPVLRYYRHPETREGGSPEGGDPRYRIKAGFVLSNSEVGHGSFSVTPRPFASVCMNSFTLKEDMLRRVHLGGKLEEGAIAWSEETREKSLALVESQIKDAITTFLTTDYLGKVIDRLREASEVDVKRPKEVVEVVAREIGMSESEQEDVLSYFLRSGDTSALGVLQAVTYHAQQVEDADHQFSLEESASTVLDLAMTTARRHEREAVIVPVN